LSIGKCLAFDNINCNNIKWVLLYLYQPTKFVEPNLVKILRQLFCVTFDHFQCVQQFLGRLDHYMILFQAKKPDHYNQVKFVKIPDTHDSWIAKLSLSKSLTHTAVGRTADKSMKEIIERKKNSPEQICSHLYSGQIIYLIPIISLF